MKLQGRKVTAWIVGIVWMTLVSILILIFNIEAGWAPYFIATITCFTFLTTVFIGGTVWKDYIKSKHFKPELFDGKK